MRLSLALTFLLCSSVRADAPKLNDWPISWSETRNKATLAYIKKHYGVDAKQPTIEPKMIVLHWTGMRSLKDSWAAFNRETLPPERGDIARGGSVNVSAHYLVDRDGTIYKLMPENVMARHVIGLNLSALGIENVGGNLDREDLTEAQERSNAWLIRQLKARHPGIEFLIGHAEYQKFRKSPLWLEKDPDYVTEKADPGVKFMKDVRELIEDLDLKGPPQR